MIRWVGNLLNRHFKRGLTLGLKTRDKQDGSKKGHWEAVIMKRIRAGVSSLLVILTIVIGALLFQSQAAGSHERHTPAHMPLDWSYRNVIYSGTLDDRDAGLNANRDPRFLRHLFIYGKRHPLSAERDSFSNWWRERGRWPFHRTEQSPLRRDWQFSLGTNAITGGNLNDSYPAKFSFDINAPPSCTNDFVVFTTGLAGSTGGQASIVALNELYSGSGAGGTGICGTGQPSVMWAYNTNLTGDTTGVIYSSPVLSLDGTEVAFVETSSSGAILKILRWVSGQGTVSDAVAPTPITSGNPWSACPASGTSCLFSLPFSNGAADSISSPFYNYSNDTLYVGDNVGVLHKFAGVFYGTPAEVTSGGWPITIIANNYLTGPTFDSVSGNIFVADLHATGAMTTSLHYVREIGSTVGTCASSGTPPCVGTPSLTVSASRRFGFYGVYDPPVVDVTSQHVFVYTSNDPSNHGAVIQATTALANEVDTPIQPLYNAIFDGAFDSTYRSGNYASGFLYVCGNRPLTLYRVGFNSSGVMNSALDAGNVNVEITGDLGTVCSPMTEILNGANDYLFFGLGDLGSPSGCSGGCILGLNLTGMTWPPSISAFSILTETGGPSGIIVDNVGTDGQESSIYFGPRANTCASPSGSGCAVKATQSGLN